MIAGQIRMLPERASTFAGEVDHLFLALCAFTLLLGGFLTILVVSYAVRYRAGSPADRSGRRARSLPLEIAWISATVVVAFGLFIWGAAGFLDDKRLPPDALVIDGLAKQWMWKFRHPGGQGEINALHIPVGRPVVVSLSAEDVIHSFFVPAFRVKQDAVPGRTTELWFQATEPGQYHLFCAEYCGTEHSKMTGWIFAMTPQAYADWLDAQPAGESPAAEGKRLFSALGCSGCHGAGAEVRAPDLAGIWGRPVATDSGVVTADAAYVRDSILQPERRIAAGYAPRMPSFDGLIDEGELQSLIAYIRSMGDEQ